MSSAMPFLQEILLSRLIKNHREFLEYTYFKCWVIFFKSRLKKSNLIFKIFLGVATTRCSKITSKHQCCDSKLDLTSFIITADSARPAWQSANATAASTATADFAVTQQQQQQHSESFTATAHESAPSKQISNAKYSGACEQGVHRVFEA